MHLHDARLGGVDTTSGRGYSDVDRDEVRSSLEAAGLAGGVWLWRGHVHLLGAAVADLSPRQRAGVSED